MNNQKSLLKRIASIGAIWFLFTGSAFAQTATSGDVKQLWQLLDQFDLYQQQWTLH